MYYIHICIEEVICNLSVTLPPLPLLVFHCEVLIQYVGAVALGIIAKGVSYPSYD